MVDNEGTNVLEEKTKVFKELVDMHSAFTLREVAAECGLPEDSYVDKEKPEVVVNLEGTVEALVDEKEKLEWLEKAVNILLAKQVESEEESEDDKEDDEDDKAREEELRKLQDQMAALKLKREELEKKKKEKEEAKQERNARKVKKKDIKLEEKVDNKENELPTKVDMKSTGAQSSVASTLGASNGGSSDVLSLLSSNSILRREFNIRGSIERGKLSYSGLVKQIKDGQKKGYSDQDIISGVEKAITSADLRTYLEISTDITLDDLLQMLSDYYKDKTATELYQELIKIKQGSYESASDFLMKAMRVRKQCLFASKKDDSVSYDAKQLQKLFISTLESGIERDVCARIQPYLTDNVSDLELMHQVAAAEAMLEARMEKDEDTSSNTQNKTRGRSTNRSTSVNSMQLTPTEETELVKTLKGIQNSVDYLTKQNNSSGSRTRALSREGRDDTRSRDRRDDTRSNRDGRDDTRSRDRRDETRNNRDGRDDTRSRDRRDDTRIRDGREDTRIRDGRDDRQSSTYIRPACNDCRRANLRCGHCFKCGGQGHLARDCNPQEPPENC